MSNREVKLQDIDDLLAYKTHLVSDINLGELTNESGMYVDYLGWIDELHSYLVRGVWSDQNYSPEDARNLVDNLELIEQANSRGIRGNNLNFNKTD